MPSMCLMLRVLHITGGAIVPGDGVRPRQRRPAATSRQPPKKAAQGFALRGPFPRFAATFGGPFDLPSRLHDNRENERARSCVPLRGM